MDASRVRNFCIVAHIDHGKSTLSDRLIEATATVDRRDMSDQLLDSMAVDSAGNVCVATLMTSGISVISPDGASVEHLPTPDPLTTNICFGGPDLRTAYITLTGLGTLVAMDWPRPGLKLHYTR